jgi:3-oxoadipate enol-lactonase
MKFASLASTVTAYDVIGEGGPPLLLLHGAEADHRMFERVVPRLAASRQVIVYDQRDCGLTSNGAQPYGLTDLADDALQLLDHLGIDSVSIYGTSMGGQVAQVLAAKLGARAAELVLGSTWPVGPSIRDFNPEVAARLALLRADPVRNADEIARYFFPPGHLAAHPEAADLFRAAKDPVLRERRRAALAQPPAVRYEAITARTFLVAGELDALIPPAVTLGIARLIPGASSHVLSGAGHVPALQCPERLADALLTFFHHTPGVSP